MLHGSAGSPGGLPSAAKAHPLPPARDAAAWVSFSRRDPSQLKKKKEPKTQKAAKGLSEEGKGQRSCQMVSNTVASPAGP